MVSPLTLETLAQDIARERAREAQQHALLAQLPRAPHTLPFATARHGIAAALRTVATRLDPSLVVADPARAAVDRRLLIARH